MGEIVAGAIIGGMFSMIGGQQAASAAEDASRRQEAMAQQDINFRREVYNQQQALYGPLQQRLVALANSDQPLNWAQVSGQISNQYSDQARQINQMGGQGQFGGLKYDRLAKLGLANATGRVAAYNQGLLNRLNLGTQLVGAGQSATMGAAQMYAQGMGTQSQVYGQQAATFGSAAANAYANAGKTISDATLAYSLYNRNKTSTTTTTPKADGQ